tara:strand:- start:1115 stop:2287 length:1173 start_codon:yes stop_codon:yes gene_type:complete
MNDGVLIIGAGYVGMSHALGFAKNCKVKVLDIDQEKVNKINDGDLLINEHHHDPSQNLILNVEATTDRTVILEEYKYVLICLPTDLNDESGDLETTIISDYIKYIIDATKSYIIIKSTVPIGYTQGQIDEYGSGRILFSPEFLREDNSYPDIQNPSRIIYGSDSTFGKEYHQLVEEIIQKKEVEVLFMSPSEAEAVKLFSNTYLAMRVAFFNELDNFAITKNLRSKKIIQGVSSDPRVGMYYNNPSFGYGGYCLPKDTKQLSELFKEKKIPNNLISSIDSSNQSRMKFISKHIAEKGISKIGIYRINMKKDSSNFRNSAIITILKDLLELNYEVFIYEPLIVEKIFFGCKVIGNIDEFKNKSQLIITNRFDKKISDVENKIYSRDIFGKD